MATEPKTATEDVKEVYENKSISYFGVVASHFQYSNEELRHSENRRGGSFVCVCVCARARAAAAAAAAWATSDHHSKPRPAPAAIMAYSEPVSAERELVQANTAPRKPHILLAASGSVAAIKFANLCHCFSEWAEVRAVATRASLHFIDRASLPKDVILYTDEDEWSTWTKIGDSVLHIELRRWADIMVIAPLSANTLGKIAGGLCDNLLTCIVRAWDYSKPLFVAPAMNTFMWNNPFTERHLMLIDELGISLIPPVTKRLACGDYGNGAMAEPSLIFSTVRLFLESRSQSNSNNIQ